MASNSSTQPPSPIVTALLAMATLVLAGCAGSAGSARPLLALTEPDALARYTKLHLTTTTKSEAIKVTPGDGERIVALVARKLQELSPGRFSDFASAADAPETLAVTIVFTRYDEGNAFARFMLAGLGQIHIDAEVSLEDRQRQMLLGKSEVTKAFAWGGIYGGSTGIRDVEEGFAEAVAKVVLGRTTD
jgi:hypothetical protein